jgi:hypothetical protein
VGPLTPTAFRWTHASWDNAEAEVPRSRKTGRRGGTERSTLASWVSCRLSSSARLIPTSGSAHTLKNPSSHEPLVGAQVGRRRGLVLTNE